MGSVISLHRVLQPAAPPTGRLSVARVTFENVWFWLELHFCHILKQIYYKEWWIKCMILYGGNTHTQTHTSTHTLRRLLIWPLCASGLSLDWLESDLSSELSHTHTEDSCLSWLSCDPATDHRTLNTTRPGIKPIWRTGETSWGCPLCRKEEKTLSCGTAWGSHLKLLVLLKLGKFSNYYSFRSFLP